MVEGRVQPVGRVVALLASRREARLHVIRVRGAIEIRLVAGHTRCRSRQVVCPARAECRVVTLRALQRSVSSVEGEAGG